MTPDVSTGIGTARRIDQLGRIVVPAELRKLLGITSGALLDFRIVDGHLSIFKVDPACALCGSESGLIDVSTKHVCRDCLDVMRGFALA